MSETVDVKTGEVVDTQVALVRQNAMETLVKQQDLPLLAVMEQLDTFDWKALKPHHAALLLMQKSFNSGGATTYLTFKQAILFATRCFELGLSPFGSEVFFNPNTSQVNITLEGKKMLARNRGIDLGPPQFEEMAREWSEVAKMNDNAKEAQKHGFPRDIGITCKMRVGDPKHNECVTYCCWLSEWYVPRSPVWQQKPLHMLQTRATEKAISLALGTGASDAVE